MIEPGRSYVPSRANQEPIVRFEKWLLVECERGFFFFSNSKLKDGGETERERVREREKRLIG